MSVRIFDGQVYLDDDDVTTLSTSSNLHHMCINGDTIRLAKTRNVTLNSTGNVGEICWRGVTVLGITTYYICVCVAPNTWRGTALSNLPI